MQPAQRILCILSTHKTVPPARPYFRNSPPSPTRTVPVVSDHRRRRPNPRLAPPLAMADQTPAATSASPQKAHPDQLPTSASTPQNPNPNPLNSPQIPPSPTISDLSAISSPQLPPPALDAAAAAAAGGTLDFPQRPPLQQAPSPTQASGGGFSIGQMHRSGSASRLAAGQMPQYAVAAAAGRMYGGQMSFSGGAGAVGQVGQQQLAAARAAMLGQGQLGMLQGQTNAAAHFGLQSQMMAQPRQKGVVQGAQFNTTSAAQALQGVQSMGMMGTLGMNQMRPNGTIPYTAQQRFAHAQMRPQQASSPQAGLPSPQKVTGQNLARTTSIAALNSQLSGSSQNGQLVQMSVPQQQQQQWLKQIQSSMPSPVSPSHHLQQQQQRQLLLMQQHLSSGQFQQKSSGLSQHQIAQAQQQHPHLNAQMIQQQHLHHQLQQFQQQQQQQQSPRISAPASQKSGSLTGSQPGTPLSGATMTGGSASQGGEATANQLLGKRKIRDLVAQVDPLGKLDPEVEDILLEIADDFIDSVTTFACSLAKHRKSSILEPKDVLLHLERNWHLSVPGFSREDKNHQRNSVRSSMDPQQPESEAAGVKGTNKFVLNNSVGNHNQVRQLPTPEPSSLPSGSGGTQMLSTVHRF